MNERDTFFGDKISPDDVTMITGAITYQLESRKNIYLNDRLFNSELEDAVASVVKDPSFDLKTFEEQIANQMTEEQTLTAFSRRTETNLGLAGNHCRFIRLLCLSNGFFNLLIIMTVYLNGIPAHGLKTLNLVCGVCLVYRAVYGDVVIIPKHYQLVQTQMSGQRNCLFGNTFHQATIAVDDIGIVRA